MCVSAYASVCECVYGIYALKSMRATLLCRIITSALLITQLILELET